jgi:hypothetical protein
VQQQAELLAKRLDSESTNTARIQKAYRLVFGRSATVEELQLGIDYLVNEPMKQYEDRKQAELDKAKNPDKSSKADSIAAAEPDDPKMVELNPEGMMAGVVPPKPGAPEKKPLLQVTPIGRYLKVLLSSNEFTFIN